MQTPMSLADRIHLEEVEATRLYRGEVADNLQRAFGGQVLAESLLAAYNSVPDERIAHSLHAYFLRPGRTDLPVLYDIENTREGKSFSARRVIARQGGKNIFQDAISFHVPEPGLEHHDAQPTQVDAPENCPSLADLLAEKWQRDPATLSAQWSILDVRYAGGSGTFGSIPAHSHAAHLRVWVKTRAPLPSKMRWHQAALAYASDLTLLSVSTVPHDVHFGSDMMQSASIDHSMWFHRPCHADEWILYDQISPSASSALGFSYGRLFQDGKLVASCAQEGLIRVVDDM